MDTDENSTIYLVRHGESMGNIKRILLSPEEDVLTETGQEQVERLGKHLSDVKFSLAFSSDYQRAMATANGVLKASQDLIPELTQDIRLRERFCGELEGKTYQEGLMCFQEAKAKGEATSVLDFETKGGESISSLSDRLIGFLKELCDKLDNVEATQNVLIISHSFAVATLLNCISVKNSQEFILRNWNHEKDFKVMENTCYMKIKVIKKLPEATDSPRILEFMAKHQGDHLKEMVISGSFSSFTKAGIGKDYNACVQQ